MVGGPAPRTRSPEAASNGCHGRARRGGQGTWPNSIPRSPTRCRGRMKSRPMTRTTSSPICACWMRTLRAPTGAKSPASSWIAIQTRSSTAPAAAGRLTLDVMDFGAVCPSDRLDLTQDADRVDDVETLWRLSRRIAVDCTLQGLSDPCAAIFSIESLARPLQGFALGLGLRSLLKN